LSEGGAEEVPEGYEDVCDEGPGGDTRETGCCVGLFLEQKGNQKRTVEVSFQGQ